MTTSFPILDLVIGLIFIFFLLSIMTSSAVEVVITIGRARAKILEKWLISIFNKPAVDDTGAPLLDKDGQPVTIGHSIMDHCLVTARTGSGQATPYISATNFVAALLDKVTLTPSTAGVLQPPPATLDDYKQQLAVTPHLSNELKRTFLAFANEATEMVRRTTPLTGPVVSNILGELKTDMTLFRERMEAWYDDMEDRFTDKLKRGWTVWLTAVCGAFITIGSNADAINIGKYLYSHKEVSTQLANNAVKNYQSYSRYISTGESALATNIDDTTRGKIDSAVQRFRDLRAEIRNDLPQEIPFGWRVESYPQKHWYARAWNATEHHFFGWLAMVLAIMLGAPFWFDLLNRFANIRGTGPKPASSADAGRAAVAKTP